MTRMSMSTDGRLSDFSQDRAELLKLLLEKESRRSQKIIPCPRASGGTVRLPASWAQQRLWFIHELEGGTQAYNMAFAIRLQGALSRHTLQEALDALVARHESLRTTFTNAGGEPQQEIAPDGRFLLQEIDLTACAAQEREEQLRRHKQEELHEKFDLRSGPLIRGRLLRMSAKEHVLLVTMHHIISDGWSLAVLFRELADLYVADPGNRASVLPPLPIQYADYAQWQRQRFRGPELENQLSYWLEQLQSAPAQLDLPTDRPRPDELSFHGQNVRVVLDAPLTAALRELAREQGMTLFMVLYAAWAILLARLSGHEDVVVGTPFANRQRPEVEGLIGFFVNTLVLRAQVRDDLPLDAFLKQVRATTLQAYDHQDAPFERVVEALRPQRSLSRNPLFQVSFALQNAPKSELRLGEVTATLEETGDEPAIFDLTLALEERADRITGSVNFATDIFDRQTIERWVECYVVVLGQMTQDTHVLLRDLSIVSDEERHRVVTLFNATRRAYPREPLVHELVEQQAERRPDAIAIVCADQSLTYRELNARANRLARYMAKRGVGAESLIAVCTERGLDMVVALLAVLKAGGAYVPLDVNYPWRRLEYMLKDSAPAVLLTQERLEGILPAGATRTIVLDAERAAIDLEPDRNLERSQTGLAPGNLAYVIYTSGSTGHPKGVMIEHRSLLNLVHWHCEAFGLDERCRSSCVAALGFDAAVWEIWPPLSIGATLVMVSHEVSRDPDSLLSWWTTQPLDISFLPTPMAELAFARGMRNERLRTLLVGGDRLRSHCPFGSVQLVNNYGPTEATVVATSGLVRSGSAVLDIGRPLANGQIYILDRNRQPLPVGVPGELWVGGAGIARGYLHRPELTAERFIPDPFGSHPEGRLYRTGDLGRWRADGTIEYLGRNDQQVKVRGFRIELGEIENQILQHAHVKEAAVVAQEETGGEKRLVAYVVGERKRAMPTAPDDASGKLRDEFVGEWESIYDQTYGADDHTDGPSFIGWNSSYDGQPITKSEMQEWRDCTVARILALRPAKVLEIGCGLGLLLERVAPHCAVYVGTDFSASALARVRRWTQRRDDLKHVELMQCLATDLHELEAGSFDTVVINSVVQYFPDVDYLIAVLEGAARLLGPGGRIFVGDVRHLALLQTFHSAVQLGKAAATVRLGQLRRRIARAVAQEKELVIDPRFFRTLPRVVPAIGAVEVQMRRGRAQNELTRYRYDVVLHRRADVTHGPACETVQWRAVGSLTELSSALSERRWRVFHLAAIPNRRVAKERAAQRLIETGNESIEAAALRRHLSELQLEGYDPEDIWELGAAHGYDVEVDWGPEESPECMNVLLFEHGRPREAAHTESAAAPAALLPMSAHVNDPLENSFRQQLIPELKDYLKSRLPEYMVPATWVTLRKLPLTPNGKLDRRGLPAPQSRPEEMGEYVAPRTELERALADIWAQILRIDQVGAQDNFFELGGHSLLIVQMLERLRRAGLFVHVRDVYASPTLADLAGALTREGENAFESPPNLIPENCTSITPQMLPLVELQPEHIARIVQAVPGGARNVKDIYPLAPLQEGILFHHLANENGGDAYARSVLLSFASRGKLNEFAQALQNVVDRHDILRTAVLWEQLPQPLQVVYRRAVLPVETLALDSNRDAVEQLNERMRSPLRRTDLTRAPLICLEIAADPRSSRWLALLHTHHLVFDAESMQLMLAEVMAFVRGRAQDLPAPVPYRDHVAQALAYQRASDAEVFFRRKLADANEVTAPFGLQNVWGDGSSSDEARRSVDRGLAERLRALARRLNVSAATLFHSVWALVIAHTSGREDVVFGSVLLGRFQGSAGAQRVLGMFINSLPLRLRVHGLSAEELVTLTHQELVELLAHDQASLALAQRCSGVPRSGPLFSALLNYVHRSLDAEGDLLSAEDVRIIGASGGTNYPFLLTVYDQLDGFVLEAKTDRRVAADRILGYVTQAMQSLLTALESTPQSPALTLSILTETERRQVIESFNDTEAAYPQDKLVHELFEEQVRRTPHAVAMTYGAQKLSYAELNRRANQLARYLRKRGVGPDDRVALCVERCVEMLVGILGVLKAGGAYVPLDPSNPANRLQHVLNDAAPKVLLTMRQLASALPDTSAEVVVLDHEWTEIGREDTEDLHAHTVQIGPENLAYVIYTSGSTGTPKGVMVEHRNLVNYVCYAVRAFDVAAGDGSLVATSISFDLGLTGLYPPLLAGRTVRLCAEERGIPLLATELSRCRNLAPVKLTPSHLGLLEQALPSGELAGRIRVLVCGGEQLQARAVQLWRKHAPETRIFNHYGPTETTVGCIVHELGAEDPEGALPIGRPIANTQVYILDRHLQPVPIGVTGEIYIGGAGVARGYLHRPELTAQRFVADPFRARPGARLYRTGDLGRWRADGVVEYLGRNDHQVKIRGFRVELGEVEAELVRHEHVAEAVVVVKEDGAGGRYLVAYVTANRSAGIEPTAEGLRNHLKSVLPDYMVPTAFKVLPSFPMTPNGKLDRSALPAPDLVAPSDREYYPPVGATEETLAEIWQSVLRVQRVGRRDDFFELGGHSLHAIRLVSGIAARFDFALPVSAAFQHPTVEQMARFLESQRVEEYDEGTV